MGPGVTVSALGTPLGIRVPLNTPIREACARARGAFWAQSGVLLQDVPLLPRYKLFEKTVQAAGLWNAGCFPIQRQGLQMLNACQHKLLRRLRGFKRAPGEAWLPWEIRTLRETRALMHHHGVQRWSTVSLQRIWNLWGHLARHPSVARRVLFWRCLSWWRREQQNPRGARHPARFCPHTDPERKLQEAVDARERGHVPWEEVAQDRQKWASLRETFVQLHDVPWASEHQVALEDGDHLQAPRDREPREEPPSDQLALQR